MTTISQADKVKALHDQLTEGVKNLVTGEQWQNMLNASRNMYRYSANNQILIMLQDPDATYVAGYGRWKSLGRQVQKGAHGIAILAPVRYKVRDDEHDTEAKVLKGFRVAYVFDVRRTDGPELADLRPKLIEGDAPRILWDTLAKRVDALGYKLTVEPIHQTGLQGFTNPTTKRMVIKEGQPAAQQLAVLLHEIAHVELKHVDDMESYRAHRGVQEVEADSVAYIVAGALGIDAGVSSFPYIAGWSRGNADIVRSTAERVMATSRSLLDLVPGLEKSADLSQGLEIGLVPS